MSSEPRTEPPRPRTPHHLGAAGRALWGELADLYVFGAGDTIIAEKAARCADDCGRLEAELRGAPLTVAGSTGQTRANPLLAELRAFRAQLAALIRQLALSDEEPAQEVASVRLTASQIGSRAARARWDMR